MVTESELEVATLFKAALQRARSCTRRRPWQRLEELLLHCGGSPTH